MSLGGRHLVLLGLMGSGKTSIGRRVAERLGRVLVDGDVELEAASGGRTAAEIARDEGIEALHRRELDVALTALARTEPAVVGPAASTVEDTRFRDALAEHVVVWFTAPAAYLAERAVLKSHRPLLDDGDPVALFERQLSVRQPLVAPLADLVIDVSRTSKDAAATEITRLVGGRP